MKVWKKSATADVPVEVEVEILEYPHRDSDDETIYENSHFAEKSDAWDAIIETARSRVESWGSQVREKRDALQKVETRAATAAMRYAATMNAYEYEMLAGDRAKEQSE